MLKQTLSFNSYWEPCIFYESEHYPDVMLCVYKVPLSAKISFDKEDMKGDIYFEEADNLIAAINEFKTINIHAIAWDELFPQKPLIERMQIAILDALEENQIDDISIWDKFQDRKDLFEEPPKRYDSTSIRVFNEAIRRLIEQNQIVILGQGDSAVLSKPQDS